MSYHNTALIAAALMMGSRRGTVALNNSDEHLREPVRGKREFSAEEKAELAKLHGKAKNARLRELFAKYYGGER